MIEARLKQDLKKRQTQVLNALGKNMLILPSGGLVYRVGQSYPFRQDSNSYYLTGFPEKDSVALFDPMHKTEQVTLFVKEKIRQEEVWQGFAIGVKKTKQSTESQHACMRDKYDVIVSVFVELIGKIYIL